MVTIYKHWLQSISHRNDAKTMLILWHRTNTSSSPPPPRGGGRRNPTHIWHMATPLTGQNELFSEIRSVVSISE